MPGQVFQVLQCFSCKTFQVQQRKKSNKWSCKMCGEKQSVKKVYGEGTGAECRVHVQKLNTMRGEMDALKENQTNPDTDTEDYANSEIHLESETTHHCHQTGTHWGQYLDNAEDDVDEDQQEESGWTTDRRANRHSLKERNRKSKASSRPYPVRKPDNSRHAYMSNQSNHWSNTDADYTSMYNRENSDGNALFYDNITDKQEESSSRLTAEPRTTKPQTSHFQRCGSKSDKTTVRSSKWGCFVDEDDGSQDSEEESHYHDYVSTHAQYQAERILPGGANPGFETMPVVGRLESHKFDHLDDDEDMIHDNVRDFQTNGTFGTKVVQMMNDKPTRECGKWSEYINHDFKDDKIANEINLPQIKKSSLFDDARSLPGKSSKWDCFVDEDDSTDCASQNSSQGQFYAFNAKHSSCLLGILPGSSPNVESELKLQGRDVPPSQSNNSFVKNSSCQDLSRSPLSRSEHVKRMELEGQLCVDRASNHGNNTTGGSMSLFSLGEVSDDDLTLEM